MRRWIEWGVIALCVASAVLGAALIVTFGPDSRRTTGPHRVDTDALAIVTKPGVISWVGITLDVLVEVPVNKPVFVGLGNSVDVEAYVSSTQRLLVTGFGFPWSSTSTTVGGQPYLPGAPTAADWWVAADAGLGAARISTQLPDATTSLAILSVGSSNLSGLEVSLGWGIKGAFAKGVGLLLLGVGGLLAIGLMRRGARLWAARRSVQWQEVEEEQVVYVWADEFGLEHEVAPGDTDYESFAAAAEPEPEEPDEPSVIEPTFIEPVADTEPVEKPEPESEPEPAPRPPAAKKTTAKKATAKKVTAKKVTAKKPVAKKPAAKKHAAAKPAKLAAKKAAAKPAEAEPREPVYFWVDEAGVEHEILASDIGDLDGDTFEVVDDPEVEQ